MPRKSPTAYSGAVIDPDHQPFDAARVKALLEAVGAAFPLQVDEESFKARLNEIAQLNAVLRAAAEVPRAKADRAYLEGLERASRALRGLLRGLENGAGQEGAGQGDAEEEGQVPEGVLRLLEAPLWRLLDARAGSEGAAREMGDANTQTLSQDDPFGPAGITLPSDLISMAVEICTALELAAKMALDEDRPDARISPSPTERTVAALMRLYRDAFDRKVGVSHPGSGMEASGPMIRFIQAACKVMGITVAPETIAKIKQRQSYRQP